MKNKVYRVLAIICFIVLLIFIISGLYQKNTKASQVQLYQIYVVKSGDTLWDIAKQYTRGDPRELIYQIRQSNNLSTSIIYAGQELKIPR